jgi:hypothetical protein
MPDVPKDDPSPKLGQRPPAVELIAASYTVSPLYAPRGPEGEGPLRGSYEVNERCLEMLVSAARHEQGRPFALVSELRELLKSADPLTRQRAARRTFLLVDMEFANDDWWHAARSYASQQMRTPPWRGSFPRTSGIQLARATLLFAWNSLRASPDPATVRLLLGMTPRASEVITNLRFEEIDRIAQKHFRHVRPRWDDRPAVWRRLLLAAQSADEKLMGAFNLHGLQLLAGELLADEER